MLFVTRIDLKCEKSIINNAIVLLTEGAHVFHFLRALKVARAEHRKQWEKHGRPPLVSRQTQPLALFKANSSRITRVLLLLYFVRMKKLQTSLLFYFGFEA